MQNKSIVEIYIYIYIYWGVLVVIDELPHWDFARPRETIAYGEFHCRINSIVVGVTLQEHDNLKYIDN